MQWRLRGTFAGPGHFGGVAPTGKPIELEGFDLLTVRDGLIQSNDAFTDSMTFARQIGMMPAQGSSAEARMMGAFNARTRLSTRLGAGEAGLVAEGVWMVQGQPGRCNVYLIEDGCGVTLFDAGARTMTRAVASAGASLGGIRRVVLGHGHTDHRGVAPALGVPVLCHPLEVEDAEGSGGFRYWPEGLAGLPTPMRQMHRLMHRYAWDGGPVEIAGTLAEGDEVAGFEVVHLPGHAPGHDRAVAQLRPAGAEQRLLLHARHVGARLRAAASLRALQLRHRAGAREHAQARRTGARGGMARPRQARDRRRARSARTGRGRPLNVGRRARRHEKLTAPHSDYSDPEGNTLTPARLADGGLAARVCPGPGGLRQRAPLRRRRTPGSAPSSCCSSGWPCAG